MILRAGLSGCGRAGAAVIESVRTHSYCDVIALHDPDPAARERLGRTSGIQNRVATFEELLATGVDFVVLAGPCGVRADQVRSAAAAGVHCLLHAPMATDAATAVAMVAACDGAGVKLGVAVPPQADPLLEQLRQMVAADWLGGVVLVTGVSCEDRALREPPPLGDWMRDPALGGASAMLRLASHHVHLASWLAGRSAVTVTAQGSKGFTALPDDATVATARLRGGALCTFAASHLARASAFAVYGTDGALCLAGDRIALRGRNEFKGEVFDYLDPGTEVALLRADLGESLAALAPAAELHGRFARWIDDLDDFPCPGEQGALDQQVLDAIARAAASGRAETV